MERKISVNYDGKDIAVPYKSKVLDILKSLNINDNKILGFRINNEIKNYEYEIVANSIIEPIYFNSEDGYRIYSRTLKMVLYMALQRLYSEADVEFMTTINKDQYFVINNIELNAEKVEKIKDMMTKIIEKNYPITKRLVSMEEATELYKASNNTDKLTNLENKLRSYVSMYFCDSSYNSFYGALAASTGAVKDFDLIKYRDGALLVIPDENQNIKKEIKDNRLYDTFIDFNKFNQVLDVENVGNLNDKVLKNKIGKVIQASEAIHQRKLVELVQDIEKRREIKMILIAGPSSSGKTTFAQKLGVQLNLIGYNPITISMDNYFKERVDTPLGPDGKYDFECVEALDIELFNTQMKDLIDGKQVELPRFDFVNGIKQYKGDYLKMEKNDILIIEGIHALNPILTTFTPDHNKYKIYIAPIATLNIDGYTKVSSTDTRLLRRMVRDYATRGNGVEKTFDLWKNVKKGEEKYIFPFVDTVDFVYNSSLVYEPGVIKTFAQPLLLQVEKSSKFYSEARRLYEYLNNFLPIETSNIPVDSIIREFIGNGCFYR